MSDPAAPSFEEDYYSTFYRDYERQNPDRKLRHYVDTVRSALADRSHPKVLDLGCAFGRFLASLDPGWQAFGADVSKHAVAWAREHVGHAEFAVIGESTVPFDERFDAITAWDVLEHIPDLDRAAREIREHLEDHAALVFVVPVYDGPLGSIVRALDADPTHIHKCSRQFWIEWASRTFDVEDWWGIFRYLVPGGPYLHFPSKPLRAIAPAILVRARAR